MVWLSQFHRAPAMTYVTHGEPDAADSLRKRIEEELKWKCIVPAYRDEAELEMS
jgi:metallo-beta-lactamase family protein